MWIKPRMLRDHHARRIVVFVAQCLGGTLIACLPALLLVASLHLFDVGTGVSLPVLLATCLVVGMLHACRRLA